MKPFAAQLVAGEQVRLEGVSSWLSSSQLPFNEEGNLTIAVDEHLQENTPSRLIFHPEVLALGVGCERNLSLIHI